jgi:hypothetical protein
MIIDNEHIKEGITIIVIGRPHEGKSPTIKALIEGSGMENRIIYDKRREYDADKYTLFREYSIFKNFIKNVTASCIVIEEATSVVTALKDNTLTDTVIGCEHNLNIVILVFHAILDVPKYLLRNCALIYLFKTNDDPEDVRRSRPAMAKYLNMAVAADKEKGVWSKPVIIDNYKK